MINYNFKFNIFILLNIDWRKPAIANGKETAFAVDCAEDFIEVLAVGVCDEYLTETIITTHHLHNPSYSA